MSPGVPGAGRIAVVGGSLAGIRAAEAIRRQGFAGTLTLIGKEASYPPVDRPPLSKAFLASTTDAAADVLRVAPDLELDLRLRLTATALDTHEKTLTLDDGTSLTYDGLVIATGAAVRRLPAAEGCSNVHVLRTVDEAQALRASLRPDSRVAVIGAGVLGCEIAATCRNLGLEVSLIDSVDLPMMRVLGPQVSPFLADRHRSNGVRMFLGRQVAGLCGSPQVSGVVLDGGEIVEADLVVVAIGASPETDWLAGSGLEISDGVVCDEACFALGSGRTVVAAGDVARWRHPLLGKSVRVEHWTNAVSQGQLAGRNLVAALLGTDDPVPYDVLPYFWSDQYDWKMKFIGMLGTDVVFEEGAPGDSRFVVSYQTNGQVVGVLCVNAPAQIAPWRNRITQEMRATA